jgi:hypothetical protein
MAGPPAPPATEEVLLQSNLRELYPTRSEICITSYQQMDDAPGVILWLHTDIAGFSHYRFTLQRDSLPPGASGHSRDGAIRVGFDRSNPRPQRIVTVIEAASKSGRKTRPFSIEIVYNPAEVYAAARQPRIGWLLVQASDLALCGGSVRDWIIEAPTPQDRAQARKRWGRLVRPIDSDHAKAQAIARDLIRTLRPHDGTPSAGMQYLSGLDQLARAEAGEDRVWCGNYADIFSAACNALDIPVRKIDMQYRWSARGRIAFEIGEAHRTTEVFDRTLNRWVWMDLTFGFLGASMGDGELLDMSELVEALHDAKRLERLHVVEYEHETGAERVVSVAGSRRGAELSRFFRQDQRYKYIRRTGKS